MTWVPVIDTIRFEPPPSPPEVGHPPPSPKKCQSEAPPPQMSMTIDLPQCQEQPRGGGGERPPRPTKCQSEGGPALTKMRGGGGEGSPPPPSIKNVSLRGAGVDLPECQERHRGKHKGTKKSVFFFFDESPLSHPRHEPKIFDDYISKNH